MTQQEKQKRNSNISKMLGWEYIDKDYSKTSYQNYGWWTKNVYHNDIDPRNNKDWKGFNSDLKFHRDYNSLMEAVKFINSKKNFRISIVMNNDGCNFTILAEVTNLTDNTKNIKQLICLQREDEQEALFIGISDFAKLYNEIKL